MFGHSGKKDTKPYVPTADDFRPENINKAVLSETFRHPATTAPLAVTAACAAGFLLTLNPFVLGGAIVTGFAGAASWVVNYFFRGETLAIRHRQRLMELREMHKRTEIESLYIDFSDRFPEGGESVKELAEAYRKLYEYLRRRVDAGNPSAERFLVMVDDTYEQGLRFLQKALHISQVLDNVDPDKLERDIRRWQKEIATEKREIGEGTESAAIDALNTKIDSADKRLQRYHQREAQMHELLAKCEQLEGALESAYLDVVDLVEGASFADSNAASRLENAIKAARTVEERLQSMGSGNHEEDQMYLEEGRKLRQ